MNRSKLLFLSCATACAGAVLMTPQAPEDNAPPLTSNHELSSVLLVDVADHLSQAERDAFIATLPGTPELNSAFSQREGLYRVELTPAQVGELTERLQNDDRVEFVEPESTMSLHQGFDSSDLVATAAPGTASNERVDDPLYPFQWHFDQIDVEGAWTTNRGAGTVVAVIDTGVAYTSGGELTQVRDLSGTGFVPGYDFVSDDDVPLDEHGHGTHVAGTIAQTTNNGYGVAGIAPLADVMPIRVLDRSGRGNTADIAESIRWAADNGADIINMSLGGPVPSRIMQDAIRYAHRKGVVVIAAAGNNGWSMPSYPAAYPHVVAVAATQFDRSTTFYSNYGRYLDVAAPGGNVRVDQNDDGRPDGVMQETLAMGNPTEHEFALYMGTSMASPHVAGVAALIHSSGVTHPDRVEAVLKETAVTDMSMYDEERYGAGLIDAAGAANASVLHVSGPRSLAAAFFGALLLIGGTRRRTIAGVVTAGLVGGGLSVALTGLGAFLPGVQAFSSLPTPWILVSALPALAAYGLFGSTRKAAPRGILVGALAGLTTYLALQAVVPTIDVMGLAGVGLLDRAWLAGNAILAGAVAWAASRPA